MSNHSLGLTIKKRGLSKSNRLRSASEVSAVFAEPFKSQSVCFSVLARPNVQGIARLGVIVGKKTVRFAVKRNQFKRIIRESFRMHQERLQGLDVVVCVRRGVNSVKDRASLFKSLEKQWQELERFSNKS